MGTWFEILELTFLFPASTIYFYAIELSLSIFISSEHYPVQATNRIASSRRATRSKVGWFANILFAQHDICPTHTSCLLFPMK